MELVQGGVQVMRLQKKVQRDIIQHILSTFLLQFVWQYPITLTIISFSRAGCTAHVSCVSSIPLTHF